MVDEIVLHASEFSGINGFTLDALRKLPAADVTERVCGVSLSVMTGRYKELSGISTRPFQHMVDNHLKNLRLAETPQNDHATAAIAFAAVSTDGQLMEYLLDLIDEDFDTQGDIAVQATCLKNVVILSDLNHTISEGVETAADLVSAIQAATKVYVVNGLSSHDKIQLTQTVGVYLKAMMDSALADLPRLPPNVETWYDGAVCRLHIA